MNRLKFQSWWVDVRSTRASLKMWVTAIVAITLLVSGIYWTTTSLREMQGMDDSIRCEKVAALKETVCRKVADLLSNAEAVSTCKASIEKSSCGQSN